MLSFIKNAIANSNILNSIANNATLNAVSQNVICNLYNTIVVSILSYSLNFFAKYIWEEWTTCHLTYRKNKLFRRISYGEYLIYSHNDGIIPAGTRMIINTDIDATWVLGINVTFKANPAFAVSHGIVVLSHINAPEMNVIVFNSGTQDFHYTKTESFITMSFHEAADPRITHKYLL